MNNNKLRGALIGYGFSSAQGHVPAYLTQLDDVQIVAVADISPLRRTLARQALPGARIYSDYRRLFHGEAARLDFVDICTPPCDHAAIAHAALASGCHVLCEKPLTCTVEDAAALLDHARRARRVVFPCHNYRHAPGVKAIREIIRSGRIGKVRSVSLSIYRSTHAKGVAEWKSDWRRDSRYSGGGIAMDHGSHCFYLAFEWLQSYPVAVKARMSNLEPGKYDTEDEFTAELTFPTGLADVHLSWTAGARKLLYAVEGEKGAIRMEDDDLQIETMNGNHGRGLERAAGEVERRSLCSDWADASHAGWFSALFDEFRTAIERGDFAGRAAREALFCVHVIHTAYRSARDGCRELPLA